MDKKRIKHISNDHYKELKKLIKKVGEDFDLEAIHQFRVACKKLKAFLRMISKQGNDAEEIKISKKLKKGYEISGAIRDMQLQRPRFIEATKQHHKTPGSYLSLLRKEIEKLKPELAEIIMQNPVHESRKKTEALLPHEFSLGNFKNFVQQKWAAIYAIMGSAYFSDDNIHSIRKILKDLFYSQKIYEVADTESDQLGLLIWKGKDEIYYKQLLDELGNFQDKCTAIALMKFFWINSLDKYNQDLVELVKKGWMKDKAKLKKMLVKKLKANMAGQKK